MKPQFKKKCEVISYPISIKFHQYYLVLLFIWT